MYIYRIFIDLLFRGYLIRVQHLDLINSNQITIIIMINHCHHYYYFHCHYHTIIIIFIDVTARLSPLLSLSLLLPKHHRHCFHYLTVITIIFITTPLSPPFSLPSSTDITTENPSTLHPILEHQRHPKTLNSRIALHNTHEPTKQQFKTLEMIIFNANNSYT